MSLLSVVLPAFNEEAVLTKTVEVLGGILSQAGIDHELIFVDDGSRHRTWQIICDTAETNPRIHGIHFSRNFGKESAIFAGLADASGDCVAVMDCDLQHPAEVLVRMYRLWEQGFEVVEGVKRSRGKESLFHRISAGTFYRLMTKATGFDMSRASDFKLLDRKAVTAVLELPERNSFFRAQSSWIGFRTTEIEFDVREREAGTSKWSTFGLIKYAVSNIVGYSTLPMQFVTGAGLIFLVTAIVLGIQTLVHYLTGNAVEGFTTVILLLLIIGSILMISLGIIGYYISRIFQEVQGRPKYIISKKV